MPYSSGMLRMFVTIAKRKNDDNDGFGKSGSPKYQILGTFHANESFNKGQKNLREGVLEAYDVVMFRMRYDKRIDRWCLVKYQDRWYQILSFNADYHDNQIQITAKELENQQVNIVD